MDSKYFNNNTLIEAYLDSIIFQDEIAKYDDETLTKIEEIGLNIRNIEVDRYFKNKYLHQSKETRAAYIAFKYTRGSLKTSDNVKNQIIASYIVFPDNETFVRLVKSTGKTMEEWQTLLKAIESLKRLKYTYQTKNSNCIFACTLNKVNKELDLETLYHNFTKYYGHFELGTILSKISFIMYRYPELFNTKEKIK